MNALGLLLLLSLVLMGCFRVAGLTFRASRTGCALLAGLGLPLLVVLFAITGARHAVHRWGIVVCSLVALALSALAARVVAWRRARRGGPGAEPPFINYRLHGKTPVGTDPDPLEVPSVLGWPDTPGRGRREDPDA